METNSIHIVTKGAERVTVPDKASAIAISNALMVLECSEPIAHQTIRGNKQDLEVYEICFLDKHVNVVGQSDVEKILHWVMALGCRKVSVEKISEAPKEEEE